MNRYSEEARVACSAVRTAASLCMTVLEELAVQPLRKHDSSPVTVADFGSQALICRILAQAFPGDPIIAEEASSALGNHRSGGVIGDIVQHVRTHVADASRGDVIRWIDLGTHADRADRYWTLDPIDGTKGFLRGDQFAIALALIEDGRPVLSAVACPKLSFGDSSGIVASAVRDEGAWYVPLFDNGERRPLRVRTNADPARARFCESVESSHSSHEDAARLAGSLGITEPPIRMDSQVKYAVVAEGMADFYLRLPSVRRTVENVWDHAAGSLLVTEAGGRVTDILGRPLDFRFGRQLVGNRGIIASNGHLHDDVVRGLAELGLADV